MGQKYFGNISKQRSQVNKSSCRAWIKKYPQRRSSRKCQSACIRMYHACICCLNYLSSSIVDSSVSGIPRVFVVFPKFVNCQHKHYCVETKENTDGSIEVIRGTWKHQKLILSCFFNVVQILDWDSRSFNVVSLTIGRVLIVNLTI